MERLNWQYLNYREVYQDPAIRLQDNRINCLLFLYELNNWIDITGFCDFVVKKMMEPNGDAGKWVILNIFFEKLEVFGLLEIQKVSEYPVIGKVRLSQLGRAVSRFIFGQLGIFDTKTISL